MQLFSVTPVIETSVNHTPHEASAFNPALFGQMDWDLGNGSDSVMPSAPISMSLKQGV
jgi:hypothetical protein